MLFLNCLLEQRGNGKEEGAIKSLVNLPETAQVQHEHRDLVLQNHEELPIEDQI